MSVATIQALAQACYNGEDCEFALCDALLEEGFVALREHYASQDHITLELLSRKTQHLRSICFLTATLVFQREWEHWLTHAYDKTLDGELRRYGEQIGWMEEPCKDKAKKKTAE